MGKGGWMHPNHDGLPQYSLDEIARHTERTDRWLAVNGYVYDITNWAKRHPGGEKIITGYAGQDASDAWYAFHPNKENVTKYMGSILVGRVREEKDRMVTEEKVKEMALLEDFHQVRTVAENSGFFRPSSAFFIFIVVHILFFDILGWWTMKTFGTGWLSYCVAVCFLTIAQAQSGWSQHDYGHLSVFKSRRLNYYAQIFIMNVVKGASTDWWNFRHYNHHAKPNVLNLDPDVALAPILLVGKTMPEEYGTQKRKLFPYLNQHKYFFFILPPFLLPIYFNFEMPYFIIKRKRWQELFWMAMFWIRWQIMFSPMLGFLGVFFLYLFVRFVESHWFFWATQMSHIPMPIDYDQKHDWVTSQVTASCNVEQSWFNDWWSGHLNFQIEHHLFPTMPRHNYWKVAPLVKSLCKKHNLEYQNKHLWTALVDIVKSLKTSGQIWYDAYNG